VNPMNEPEIKTKNRAVSALAAMFGVAAALPN